MTIETKVNGYLMSYWPYTGPFSAITMVNYALVEVFFDEDDVDNKNSRFRWSYHDIGSVMLKEPVDNVHKNAVPLHSRLRQVLAANGKLKPDAFAEKCYFMKLENIGCLEDAVKLLGIRMMDDYLAAKKDINPENGSGLN